VRLHNPARLVVQALGRQVFLAPECVATLERHCESIERHGAGDRIEPLGEGARTLAVVTGWAAEQQTLSDGRRQILRYLLPGDLSEFRTALPGGKAELLALTDVMVVDLTRLHAAVRDGRAPAAMIEAWRKLGLERWARDQRHLVRLGRLSALERTGQLLIELYDRLTAAGLTRGPYMPMPLTQTQLADHLGLSVVHLNRVLQQLRRDGFIEMRGRQVLFRRRAGLATISHYELAIESPSDGPRQSAGSHAARSVALERVPPDRLVR
jgi:CRP-like cAMP-binding protein